MRNLRRLLGLSLAGALLWANASVCAMPAAQCLIKEAPPCHEPAQDAPCCGRAHLSEAAVDPAAALPAADASRALPAPAPAARAPLAVALAAPAAAPDESPPFLSPPPDRSPPAA